jgi:ABC-type microcin C transport system permease subunit YejE
MEHMRLTRIIPFIIILMLLVAAMYPTAEMILGIMLFSGLIVFVQVIAVLKGEHTEAPDPIDIPEN